MDIAQTPQFSKKLLAQAGAVLSIAIVCVAFWVMYDTLHSISIQDVSLQFKALPLSSVLWALLITIASYFVVTGYDVIALRHSQHQVPYRRAALAAFLASTFGNNIGFAILTGTSIRYRVYSQSGLSALEIAGVSSMCALTTILGMSTIFAASMILHGGAALQLGVQLPPLLVDSAGWLVATLIIGYLIYAARHPVTLTTRSWSVRMPSASTMLAQIALATTNLSLVATLIYVLLPDVVEVSYLNFLGVFALALIAGSASNVPGGIGVFESVILLGLPDVPAAALLASILMFRCMYYLAPLLVACLVLALHEYKRQKQRFEEIQDSAVNVLDEVGPQLMSLMVLLAGVILLFSGSIPIGFDRALLRLYIPLPVVELSHLIGAAAGMGLFIAARGISRRLSVAFRLTLVLLVIGITTSLLKGLGFREAIALLIILILLWYTRPEFYRKGSLFAEGFPGEWVSLLCVTLVVTVFLGLFSFKAIPYSPELWTQFSFESDYSRFLRSLMVVLGIAGVFTYIYLLRFDPIPGLPEAQVLARIRKILTDSHDLRANLALLGDKRILFSASGNSFIMYQIQGRSWVALGDPVGPAEESTELIWRFRAMCDRYGGYPVFYLVDEDKLNYYQGLNLSIEKIGDVGVIPLHTFDLSDQNKTTVRSMHQTIQDSGARLEIIDGTELEAILPELQAVSDSWIEATGAYEPGFSRGFFDAHYMNNFSCAVIRQQERIVAFSVLWRLRGDKDIGLDMMRCMADADPHIMDFLVTELALQAKQKGYEWLEMGIAPLAELQDHPLAPFWNRIGRLMYWSGRDDKAIEVLRQREEKYHPVWRAKYMVSPGGAETPKILRDIVRLISQKNVRARTEVI